MFSSNVGDNLSTCARENSINCNTYMYVIIIIINSSSSSSSNTPQSSAVGRIWQITKRTLCGRKLSHDAKCAINITLHIRYINLSAFPVSIFSTVVFYLHCCQILSYKHLGLWVPVINVTFSLHQWVHYPLTSSYSIVYRLHGPTTTPLVLERWRNETTEDLLALYLGL